MKKTLIILSVLSLMSVSYAQTEITISSESDIPEGNVFSGEYSSITVKGYTVDDITVSENSSITNLNVNYNGDTSTPAVIKNSTFKNISLGQITSSSYSWGAGFGRTVLENVDFSKSRFDKAIDKWSIIMYNATLSNVDFSNVVAECTGFLWFSGTKVENVSFRNVHIKSDSDAVLGLSGNFHSWEPTVRDWAYLVNVDFRGTKIEKSDGSIRSFSLNDITLSGGGNRSEFANVLLGDGTIVSSQMSWSGGTTYVDSNQVNDGLLLASASDRLIVDGLVDGVGAKLTVDSTASAGSIILRDNATLEIADNTTLTITDAINIVFDANANVSEISDILILGDNATVVMAGYTDAEARSAFLSMIKDSDGNIVDWSSDSVASFVKGTVVPEPAEWAMILSAFALGFAIYRKRK